MFGLLFESERAKVLSFPPVMILDDLPVSDCGVVLTGSAGRVREGFEVLAQKKVSKLVISGVYKDARLHEIFPQLVYYPEVNPENVILEKISGSTATNADQSLLVSEALKCKTVLLITSQLHMYRAYRTFWTVFPKTVEIRKYQVVNTAKEDTWLDVFIETIKSLWYSLQL